MKPLHYVADLHIHIGRTMSGKAVKITASRNLTLSAIIDAAATKKGVDIVGVIDCHVPEVLDEIEQAVKNGAAFELEGGGVRFYETTLFLGSEIELNDEEGQGPIHVLVYLPTIEAMRCFSDWLKPRMKNYTLSSQRLYERGYLLQEKVKELEGLFIPAHVFTPFKSVYGKGVKHSMAEILDLEKIDAVELGLSADTSMADALEELHRFPFVSNSDAHSLEKLAREYQIVQLKNPSFDAFQDALLERNNARVIANYGLNPYLGKYYHTTCASCSSKTNDEVCKVCGSRAFIKGVSARIHELGTKVASKPTRPPYIHQVPLEFIPKLGKKTLEALRSAFGTDMKIINETTYEELLDVVSKPIADAIIAARIGKLTFHKGGGGAYGKVDRIDSGS
nr:endonuclease Q family protein [Halalkalibacterium ligniniphilum]